MHIAKTLEDHLFGLCIFLVMHRRVCIQDTVYGGAEFIFVCLRLGGERHKEDGLWEFDIRQFSSKT